MNQLLEKGYILDNRYKIDTVAGKGGTSVVYRAFDINANMALRAVKEIRKNHTARVNMAKRESLLIKELYERDKYNSFFPNIIQNLENSDSLYIVQDYIDGTTLSRLLKSGPLPYQKVIDYSRDICMVTDFIHKYGRIHSDMKPDNIMVLSDEDQTEKKHPAGVSRLKFIDFGSLIKTEDGVSAYTPEYAAPEQFSRKPLSRATDIFSIGATMYHMLTGIKPCPVSSGISGDMKVRPSSERFVFEKGVNTELKRIILKCVSDDPSKRYRTCQELLTDINRAANNVNLKRTVLSAAASVICAVMCLFSYSMCEMSRESAVDSLLRTAADSSDDTQRHSAYLKALDLDETRADVYTALLDYYSSDVFFSVEEASELSRIMMNSSGELTQDPLYEEIAFRTGKLYWYYYNYGTDSNQANDSTRIIASKKWFSYALTDRYREQSPQSSQMAQVYYEIAVFYETIQNAVIEGYDAEMYPDLWKNMNMLTDLIDDSQTEIVLLETYKNSLNLLLSYTHKFSTVSGLSEDEQKAFLDKILKKTLDIEATTEKTQNIKNYITEHYDVTLKKIEKSAKIIREADQ